MVYKGFRSQGKGKRKEKEEEIIEWWRHGEVSGIHTASEAGLSQMANIHMCNGLKLELLEGSMGFE